MYGERMDNFPNAVNVRSKRQLSNVKKNQRNIRKSFFFNNIINLKLSFKQREVSFIKN